MNRLRQDSLGYALVTVLIVTAISTALVLGFIIQLNTEQKIARNDTDYTTSFYAAEAGLEKLNSDLAKVFLEAVFPNQDDLAAIQDVAYRPTIPGTAYPNYSLMGGQSTKLSASLNISATTVTVVSTANWPATGFFMIDAEELVYTGKTSTTFTGVSRGQTGSTAATHANNATVFRSQVVTLSEGANTGLNAQTIPFTLEVTARGVAGTETRLTRQVQVALIPVFQFGIFSDSDLSFFAGPDFDFGGRVHSNGNIFLAEGEGELTLSKVTSAKEIIRSSLANGVSTTATSDYSGTVRIMTTPGNFRALTTSEGSVTGWPGSIAANSVWHNLSTSTYNKNILSVATLAKPLTLPFVAGDVKPIELIKRPSTEGLDSLLSQARLANMASLRVFISDAAASLPGGVGHKLNNTNPDYTATDTGGVFRPPFAEADPNDPDFRTAANADESTSASLIDGFILIQMQDDDGVWSDVTNEILNLGISTNQANAILRFQKPRWDTEDNTNSQTATDYVPINIYDSRDGRFRDDNSSVGSNLRKLGIINIVELDVNNLRRWFLGSIGASGDDAIDNNGFIFYSSDRRGNRDASGNETGELGFEDFVNPGDVNGNPSGVLNGGEDLNANATLEIYGARLPYSPYTASTDLYATSIPTPVAEAAIDIVGAINSSTSSIPVSSATDISTPGYYRIDSEIVNCTSESSETLTCSRAELGTTAAAHSTAFASIVGTPTSTQTTIDVDDASSIAVPAFYRIDDEILNCTSKSSNTLTCERGRLGTTADNHSTPSNFLTATITNLTTTIPVGNATNITVPNFYEIENEIVKCTSKSSNNLICARNQLGTTAATRTISNLTTISGNITSSATTINVAAGASVPVPGLFRIDNEVLSCPSRSGNALTCTRGQSGTTAASHNSAAAVKNNISIVAVNLFKVNLFTSQRASKNRVHYFRRALRLTNGASPNLPTPGFTVVAENPLYVLGNYNSIGTANFAETHSFAAVIADAVTLLSNNWSTGGDERSFVHPYDVGNRPGATTWYRMAIAAGKGINFTKPSEESAKDFGTDGGVHNFLRYLENWSGTANYRGSLVSLYFYRQAIGPYKCCSTVYGPPTRSYAFDTDFLVPSQLPPGTPRFRDINNLSFRQTIRADQ